MNVLEVVSGYFPYYRAGVPQHIKRLLAKLLENKDFSATILAQEIDDQMEAGIRQIRLPFYPLRKWKYKRQWFFLWFDWAVRFKGPKICREQNIDVIHGHTWQNGGRQAILLGKHCGIPVVVTLHGTTLDDYSATSPPEWLDVLFQAAYIIVQKTSAMQKLIYWGYPKSQTSILIGPVGTEFFFEGVRTFCPPFRLLFAGRFDPIKRPMLLVEIAKMIKERKLPVLITAVGNGALFSNMLEQVQQYHLSEVLDLPGWTEDIVDYFRSHDFILGLSDRHNVSDLVLLEGMSCGMIPLVTESLDIDYLLKNEENGFVIGTSATDIVDFLAGLSKDRLPEISTAAVSTVMRIASLQYIADEHRRIFHEVAKR